MARKRNQKARRAENGNAGKSSPSAGAGSAVLLGQAADWRLWLPLSAAVLLISCWLLFFRLGHYPLWCDEADTALYARGIARTGDTYSLIDHNLYASRDAKDLTNLCNRYEVPGSFYFAAPFVGKNGTSSFWPRIPFAVCGLLSVMMLLYWMIRSRLSAATWIVLSLGLLGNVSFFLFCRQCRYYSLAIMLTIVIAYLYLNWNGRWSGIVWMLLASILLLWTHYLPFAALYVAMACDYLFFARRQQLLKWGHWLLLLGPLFIVGLVTVWIYNPLGFGVGLSYLSIPKGHPLLDKLTLLWWNFRDLNTGEFYVGLAMLAAPFVYLWTRNTWLLRGSIALVCYVVITTIFSPQPVEMTFVADVRYLTALIPLFIGLMTLVIVSLAQGRWPLALALAAVVFGSNVLNHPLAPDQWACRPLEFAKELWYPRATSTSEAIEWINTFVQQGESIWVLPEYMKSPLMYHAPHAVYAWNLEPSRKAEAQFAALPPVHFMGLVPPDYLIFFGRNQKENILSLRILEGKVIAYQLVKFLDVFWDERIRPEIFWRSFRPIENFNKDFAGVYVYRRETSWPGK